MRPSQLGGRAWAAGLVACGMAMAVVPVASADPAGPADVAGPSDVAGPAAPGQADAQAVPQGPVPGGSVNPVQANANAAPGDDASPSVNACKQFSGALNMAAKNYEEFAYATAGGGNNVNYVDPNVQDSNVRGRTALREAAGAAMNASTTPGLAPEVSGPMQRWSMGATKLLVLMGVHGGGDSLNTAAIDLNNSAHDAQMACASAGTPA